MASLRSTVCATLGLALAASALASPVLAQGRWDWGGGGPQDAQAYPLRGPGVELLVPELRYSHKGQAFVLRNFDFDHNGFITPRAADAANRAFLDAAGVDRSRFAADRFGWRGDAPDHGPGPMNAEHGGDWNRQGMRDYHFHQGRYGALFTLQDVLFETGSAQLRPGAEARLLPLIGYLHANPGVRLRIDGYTDSVGSADSNLQLSRDRARSVGKALAAAGVETSGFQLEGHGEDLPIASNNTAAGRQLNRRVEVTLIGRQASEFE
jgi:outer membrane protein OmpA-like peptidoglycan-associated protein